MNQIGRKNPGLRRKSPILEAWGEPTQHLLRELPSGLSQLSNAPERAFLWGVLPPPPWVSIVGTRNPTRQGFFDAFHLARRLARAGVTIASGGACGIDSAAHMGALAGRGATVVIAPTWLPLAYPIKNHPLFDGILRSGGAYLTVAEESTRPMKFAFFRRNEVLMALSHATVLGECPLQSGAKNAMLHARKLGRPRFALPFRFGDKCAFGVWTEITQQGAELLADETPVVRLLEEYGDFENPIWREHLVAGNEMVDGQATPRMERAKRVTTGTTPLEDTSEPEPLRPKTRKNAQTRRAARKATPRLVSDNRPEAEKMVLRAVLRGEVTVDGVCTATALPPEEVQHVVFVLTLSGELAEDEQGLLRFQRSMVG